VSKDEITYFLLGVGIVWLLIWGIFKVLEIYFNEE